MEIPEYPVEELVYASPIEKAYGLSPAAYEYYCRMQYSLKRFDVAPMVDAETTVACALAQEKSMILAKLGYDAYDDIQSSDNVIDFVHSTASIEGVELSIFEVAELLTGKKADADTVNVRQRREVQDISDALAYAIDGTRHGQELSIEYICKVHALAAANLDDANAGHLRPDQRYLTTSSGVLPPPPEMVEKLLLDAIAWYRENPTLERAVCFHALFEDIHPFQDGNGRCGRILMSSMLASLGLPTISLKSDSANRAAYYESLKGFSKDVDRRDCSALARLALERIGVRMDEISRLIAAEHSNGNENRVLEAIRKAKTQSAARTDDDGAPGTGAPTR